MRKLDKSVSWIYRDWAQKGLNTSYTSAIGAISGIIENSQTGGNWLHQVLQGALGGALFGAAIALSPVAGAMALGISAAKAGAEGGNFLHNFNADSVGDGAKAYLGAGLIADISGLNSLPYVGSLFIPMQQVASVAVPILSAYTVYDLYSDECDPSKHGLYETSPNMCGAH